MFSLLLYFFLLQVPYPLPKLDMICITEFAMGAMENWGLVTYRETALMIDEATASPQQKQRVAVVVAHELAHQWFGNLVTMTWWEGLWLNEGFAAYMEHFCTDVLFPGMWHWLHCVCFTLGANLSILTLFVSRVQDVGAVYHGWFQQRAAPGRAEELAPRHRAHPARRGSGAGLRRHLLQQGIHRRQHGLRFPW